MDDPVKIILKYKNNNRRVQYHVYIFVGNLPEDITKILHKIQDLSLYNSWVNLSDTEIKKLEKLYGEFWYTKLFNTYHINNIITLAKETNSQKKELIDKFGDAWFKKHIETKELIERKLLYTYESVIKDERIRKTTKKGKIIVAEEEADIDYTTLAKENIDKLFNAKAINRRATQELSQTSDIDSSSNKLVESSAQTAEIMDNVANIFNPKMKSHDMNTSDIESDINDTSDIEDALQEGGVRYIFDADPNDENHKLQNEDALVIDAINLRNLCIQQGGEQGEEQIELPEDEFEEGMEPNELMKDEEVDMDEIGELYKDIDVAPDNDIIKTKTLIEKALDDEKIFEKNNSSIIEFDTSKDNSMYEESLKDVYKKFYVINQYIFKDDTIKTIKDKICCGFKNNAKFDKDAYIIPSRQYLWSEYYFENKIEKVMVGQKWVRRNELLNIDVEPNTNLRVYEELRGSLKLLRDNIKRYGTKIKGENDENNILFDYENYLTNNEIYMTDIYNELGKGYSADTESIKNLVDVYLRIYYPKIKSEDFKNIIEYINGDIKVETGKILTTFETINNDLIMDNEIMSVVEAVKHEKEYKRIFKDNYITQSVIHVNLRLLEGSKIDLFRIFNEFIPTEQYPFIQYQKPDGQIIFKFQENEILDYLKKKENMDVLGKWFENAPYGISFKVKIFEKNTDKFMAINLNESGRIEYKTQWKEEDMATIEDIKHTYNYVKDLINKINSERNRVKIDTPYDSEFKYAFINTIQKFELPDDFVINHNDLSEFSRFFYPYVALVIEPRKRQSKIQKGDEKSKFGTYLRYKRVSKYENQARMEQRILYFMRNYDYNDQSLSNEISKQFNITEERAMEEIEKVRSRYPNIKRSRKVLKKLENIPKYKPPGIGIDIQGKQRDKYKIRISGARDKKQLDRIITFMNILIHLYTETYLYKKPERQNLKEKLKKLTNIARRRNKVDEIVNYSKEIKSVKQMTQLDKKRIGFKPEKGQSQWTRACQNSGTDKKRRPQQFTSANMEELIKAGYHFNKKNGQYEKKITIKGKGNKKQEFVLKTVKLQEFDENGNFTGNEIHYTCSPEENGDHMYVGFLTRSKNPYGHCMPCCFKKDPHISKNKDKKDFFSKCIGEAQGEMEKQTHKVIGDRLYILQDTNKIQEGRFGFLPKYLDFYFNYMLEKDKKIKHHYLVQTKTGYFFKYGSKQDEYQFLNAIGSIIDLTIDEIKKKIISVMENDKNDLIFTSLNNGDIRTQFNTRDKYIDFIQFNNYLDFDMTNNILSIPGVVTPNGLNIIIFQKRITVIKKSLEKERIKEDFFLDCQNTEEIENIIKVHDMIKNRKYY